MQRLAFEKEMLGLYVSDHPLLGAEAALRRHTEVTIREMREQREGELRWVGGVVTGLVRKYTKRGELMATFTLEDLESDPRRLGLPPHHAGRRPSAGRRRRGLRQGPPRPAGRGAQADLHGAAPRPTSAPAAAPRCTWTCPSTPCPTSGWAGLRQLLADHPGSSPVFLHVGTKVIRLADDFAVDARPGSSPSSACCSAPGVFGTHPPKPRNLEVLPVESARRDSAATWRSTSRPRTAPH